jgi:hypothetical protein
VARTQSFESIEDNKFNIVVRFLDDQLDVSGRGSCLHGIIRSVVEKNTSEYADVPLMAAGFWVREVS